MSESQVEIERKESIKKLREKVKKGEWEFRIVERREGEYHNLIPSMDIFRPDPENVELNEAFVETFDTLFTDIRRILDNTSDRSTEQAWKIGEQIANHKNPITKISVEELHPSEMITSAYLRDAENIYQMFPSGTAGDLPDIKRASLFFRVVSTADNKREALRFHNQFSYIASEITIWRRLKDDESTNPQKIAQVVSNKVPDRYSDERKIESILNFCELLAVDTVTQDEASKLIKRG